MYRYGNHAGQINHNQSVYISIDHKTDEKEQYTRQIHKYTNSVKNNEERNPESSGIKNCVV